MPRSSREMFVAHAVGLTFVDQKNRNKCDTTTMERGRDPLMDPVVQAANIVWNLRNSHGTSDATQTHHYFSNNKLQTVKQGEVLDFLRATAYSIGEAQLGFHPSEIGNKSMRSGAAMAWFLSGHRPEHIMMKGRWLSCAFLKCMRKHVLEFSKGMTESILLPAFQALPTPIAGTTDPRENPRFIPSRGFGSMASSASLASCPTFNIH